MISKICILGLVLMASRVDAQFYGGPSFNNPFQSFLSWVEANGPKPELLLTKAVDSMFGITSMANDMHELKKDLHQMKLAMVGPVVKELKGKGLIHYINEKDLGVVELLLMNGANVEEQDPEGQTALKVAEIGGSYKMLQLLLRYGANANVLDQNEWFGLLGSVRRWDQPMVELLLSCGANVNAKDEDGNTALMLAIQRGNLDMAQWLVSYNADVNLKNKRNETALTMAQKQGWDDDWYQGPFYL